MWGFGYTCDGSNKLVKVDINLNYAKYIEFQKEHLIADFDEGENIQRNCD